MNVPIIYKHKNTALITYQAVSVLQVCSLLPYGSDKHMRLVMCNIR